MSKKMILPGGFFLFLKFYGGICGKFRALVETTFFRRFSIKIKMKSGGVFKTIKVFR